MLDAANIRLMTHQFPAGLEWTLGADGQFRFRNGSAEERAAAQAIIDAFDPKAEEAKAQAIAGYRELAVAKLAQAEAEAAGDTEAAAHFEAQATAQAASIQKAKP